MRDFLLSSGIPLLKEGEFPLLFTRFRLARVILELDYCLLGWQAFQFVLLVPLSAFER